MKGKARDHTLEFLIDFDGRTHWLKDGYWLKFEIKRVPPTGRRPHGLRYAFTLHDPKGRRLVGFDNAHPVPERGSRRKPRPTVADHWHHTEMDKGRPYKFVSAEQLIIDFFAEVERVLTERGIPFDVERTEP